MKTSKICNCCEGMGTVIIHDPDVEDDVLEVECRVCFGEGIVVVEAIALITVD